MRIAFIGPLGRCTLCAHPRGGRMRNRSWRVALGLVVAAFFAACGTANPPGLDQSSNNPGNTPGGTCASPGTAGCPCSTTGESVACGEQVSKNGAYVTCSMGRSTCNGQTWGACLGNT